MAWQKIIRHLHFTCQRVLFCIVCNVLVNHVCLHALFLDVICVMSVLKEFMLYVATCSELNKTFGLWLVKCGKEISRDLWKKLNNSAFSAFEHTTCLTKNLPFSLEYFYFILIYSRRWIHLLFLFSFFLFII